MGLDEDDNSTHTQLHNRLNTLEHEAMFHIEFLEEDHEKAILVFMAVTVLFLVSHKL